MIKRLLLIALLILGLSAYSYADGGFGGPKLNVESADGTVSLYADKMILPTGSVADDGDGTVTVTFIVSSSPVDADYLVGTANGTLTNEIAVGTTPGGELGNTWASPTVDTTHSGSAHHSAITIDTNVDDLLTLTTQALSFKTQVANTVFAGRVDVGTALVPTFRSLVALDIPALPYEAANANIQSHISDNTQAHSDYVINTGDDIAGAVTINDNDGVDAEVMLTIGDADDLDNLKVYGDVDITGDIVVTDITSAIGPVTITGATPLIFEGATANDFETSFAITDPTTPDKVITFPDATGTVAVTASAPATLNSTTGDIGITVLKDLVTTSPLSGGTNDILVGADADITLSIDNISYTLLADGTDGNLITWDANGAPALVATGDANQVLTSNGAGAAPSFKAAAAGGTQSKSFVITNPTSSADSPLWEPPVAISISAVHLLCKGGVVVGHLTEQDTNGLNDAGVDGATDITGIVDTTVNDDGSLSNPTIDAGDWIGWRTTSAATSSTKSIITFDYTNI